MEKNARNNSPLSAKAPTPFHVLIAAGGSGTRLSAATSKQYMEINGAPILRHTLNAFLSCPGLQSLRVIIDPTHRALYDAATRGLNLPPPISGGANRKESVFNGLRALSEIGSKDIVLIHDAARPFVGRNDILAVAAAAAQYGAATLATPVSDTLRRDHDSATVDRTGLWAVQTPQGFHYDLIARAHQELAADNHFTDDAGMVTALGAPMEIVPGPRRNYKITTPDDMELAKQIMSNNKQTRTGLGFDVHAFEPGAAVRLCGVDISFDRKLAGHSDADVGLHALTDALLGALAAGDIGQHFPPSDPQWKNADSALFLAHAVKMVHERGGHIINVDITLICEAPKIGPHRESMQNRVAALCGIEPDRVGIKATTTEGLGFTGRGEGIAAQAVATVSL